MDATPDLLALAQRTGGEVRTDRTGRSALWIEDITDQQADELRRLGLTEQRRLHQMRRSLPIPHEVLRPSEGAGGPVRTRSFVPGRDDRAWVEVNNAAFVWHPEQGHQSVSSLRRQMDEAWFDADGFRILEEDGAMVGFCWTKVHDSTPPVGEIYVIGVSPDHTGRGLGRELTLDGLRWLHDVAHTDTAMLYVESDNAAALALYTDLGFEIYRSDASFGLDHRSG